MTEQETPARLVICIITKNESRNIVAAVQSSKTVSQDVFVLDSLSTDDTVAIAEREGARTATRVFDNYAAQRNHAIALMRDDYDWLLFLDADERIDEAMARAIRDVIRTVPSEPTAYRFKRANHFLGRRMKRAIGSDWQVRLFYGLDRLEYLGVVHEHIDKTARRRTDLDGHIIHYGNESLTSLLRKLNDYTDYEVEKRSPRSTRRLVVRLIFRPARIFIRNFILRGGFVDGYRGLIWNMLNAVYEYAAIAKQIERNLGTAPSVGDGADVAAPKT